MILSWNEDHPQGCSKKTSLLSFNSSKIRLEAVSFDPKYSIDFANKCTISRIMASIGKSPTLSIK